MICKMITLIAFWLTVASAAPLAQLVAQMQAGACPQPAVNTTLQLEKYAGTWYEIQSNLAFKNLFEAGLVCTRAVYTLEADGTVQVNNTGFVKDNVDGGYHTKTKIGKAKVVSPGKLEVSFFGPFYGPYWVTQLYADAQGDYIVSVVFSCSAGPATSQDYWILSRTPQLPASVPLGMIYATSEFYGINITALNLQTTEQDCDF